MCKFKGNPQFSLNFKVFDHFKVSTLLNNSRLCFGQWLVFQGAKIDPGIFFSEINLLLCAYRNHLCFLKRTCMFIIAMLKIPSLLKKHLGKCLTETFIGGGGVISLSSYVIQQSVVDHFFVSVK